MEDESAASLAVTLIEEDGYDPARVLVLKDGLAGWEEAGLPTARVETP